MFTGLSNAGLHIGWSRKRNGYLTHSSISALLVRATFTVAKLKEKEK